MNSSERRDWKATCLTIVAGGGRERAFADFCTALNQAREGEFTVLLVDSETAVRSESGPWEHLKKCDNWRRPRQATDDNAHLMVQCMEAWFLADKDTLAAFFGNGFNRMPFLLARTWRTWQRPMYWPG